MPGKNGKKNGKDDRKKNKLVCKGYTGNKGKSQSKSCYKYVECDNCKENECNCGKSQTYCETHLYFENFTDADIDKIKNEDKSFYVCSSCLGWRTKDKCYHCIDKRNNAKDAKKKKRIECDVLKNDGTKCTEEMYKIINEKKICKRHLQYGYSNLAFFENKDNLIHCILCSKFKEINEMDKTEKNKCIECKERIDLLKEKVKERKYDICKVNDCKYKAVKYKSKEEIINMLEENKLGECYGNYCGHHQLEGWKNKQERSNKKVCPNYIRGCREILDLHSLNKYCEKCREKRREGEKKLNDKNKDETKEKEEEELKKKLNDKNKDGAKVCPHCPKSNNTHQIKEFIDEGREYVWCIKCRIVARKADEKRGKLDRNYKPYEARPEVKERRKIWREDNPEKSVEYWRKSRAKRRKEMGDVNYLKRNAENAKKWRDINPERQKVINENRKINKKVRFGIYKMSAKKRKLEFKLSEEQCYNFFESECKRCGNKPEGLCGIDRKDNKIGYVIENCEACCTVCNMIKCDISDECLMRRIEHILNYLGIIETGNYYPDSFDNYISCSYLRYKKRADDKALNFEITCDEFLMLTGMECYLCGKNTDENHLNGIDRISSNKNEGYRLKNIVPCCADCNYMKNKYDLDEFILKIYEMYINKNNIEKKYSQNDIKIMMDEYIEEKNNDINNMIKLILKKEENKEDIKNEKEIKKIKKIEKEIKKIKKIEKKVDAKNNLKSESESDYWTESDNEIEKNKNINNNDKKKIENLRNKSEERKKAILAIQKKIKRYEEKNENIDVLLEELKNVKNLDIPFIKKEKLTVEEKREKKKIQKRKERALKK